MSSNIYDRYVRATKGWKRVLFNDLGRGLQSAELNEIQSIIGDEFAQLCRTIFSDGSIVRGCELVLKDGIANITSGQIYWGGYFHDFPGGQIAYTGTGIENIGITFTAVTVTESSDPDLRDPTLDWENKSLPGAYRLTYTLALAINNPDAVTLYTVEDGVMTSAARPSPDYAELAKTLARRTDDESGSYLVRGMKTSVEARDATTFNLVVSEGKGYIRGFEITLPVPVRTVVNRATTVRTVTAEAKTYSAGTVQYDLNATPVKQITLVTAIVERSVTMTRGGTPGGQDILPYTPVSSVIDVHQGGTTYTTPGDYLVVGDYIDWSPGGSEPATGTTYSCTFRYTKTMVAGDDYILSANAVDFSPSGDNPVDGTVFNVTYEHYLGRHDAVSINSDGDIIVTDGQPGLFPVPPPAPNDTLLISTVYFPPNGGYGDAVVNNINPYRLSMLELIDLRDRVRDLEYNAAVEDLDQEAFNIELPTAKKAILTDVFWDFNKVDSGNVLWTGSIDIFNRSLWPGFGIAFHEYPATGTTKMLPYTEALLLEQGYATDLINVNPYAVFNNRAVIRLNPPDDVAYNTSTIYVDGGSTRVSAGLLSWTEERISGGGQTRYDGISRARTVAVTGSNYTPLADNLALTMDGIAYQMTPTGTTVVGGNPGTVRADENGRFTATFQVPAGLRGGAKLVSVGNLTNKAETEYVIATVQRTTVITRVTHYYDPVAETFIAPETCYLSALDLYFGAKDSTLGLTVTIRNSVNGYPGQEILAEAVLLSSQVATSANGSTATHIVFNKPAFVEAGREYAIVVATESIEYGIWYAKMGGTDKVSGKVVTRNPFAGVMFTSSNASAWTPDQTSDLKFKLYRCNFESQLTLSFDAQAVDGSQMYLFADAFLPQGTRIKWEYNAGAEWLAFEPAQHIDTGAMMTNVGLRATLYGTPRLSPILALPPTLLVMKWNADGTYVSRNTVLPAFSEIRVYMDVKLPDGTSIALKYSTDDGTNWNTMGTWISQGAVGDGYTEYLWTVTGLPSPTQLRIRADLTSSGDRTKAPSARRLRVIAT